MFLSCWFFLSLQNVYRCGSVGVSQCVLTTFLCWQCMVCGRSGLHGVCAPSPVVGVTAPEPESAHHLSMVVGAVMAQKLRVNSATLLFAQVCSLLFLPLWWLMFLFTGSLDKTPITFPWTFSACLLVIINLAAKIEWLFHKSFSALVSFETPVGIRPTEGCVISLFLTSKKT